MIDTNDKSGYYAALLFLIWPFLAVASAFRNYRSSWGKNILWAFIAFYGFVFAIGAESQGSDIVRYVENLKQLHSVSISLMDGVRYYQQSGEIDILRIVIDLVLSRFTDSQIILTFVYGIIFGFFFSRNMWYILERLKGKIKPITILLFTCFFLVIPIWNINSFRMWTAAHMFIYGLLPYLFEGKRGGAVVASMAILVHFSFIVPVAVLYAYIFLGNRLVLYFSFFLITFFFSEINMSVFNYVIKNYAPQIVQERTESYRSESAVEGQRGEGGGGNKVWYARYYRTTLRWSIKGFLIVIFLKGRKFFTENIGWLSLLSFTLLFYGVANLFSSIPSGGRFLAIADLLALALIILYVQNRAHEVVMKRFIIAATPLLLLFVVVAFRIGLYSMSASAILSNPVIAMFWNGDYISLNDFMKEVLL